MQIKFCYKMARNDDQIIICANTVQENERMLQQSCKQNQAEIKSKEDFEKLFIKLNYVCQVNSTKEDTQLNITWSNKTVTNYTYGPVLGFPAGSWWGIRMDCSRDRVHDPFDENLQIGPFGVTSICTSSINLNEDVDVGNSLTLTGQKYVDGKSEKDPLVKNYETQIPVRLIRSYNLLNEFAPKTGYRYDGLYIVTNYWVGVNSDSSKYYKFALTRLNDQEPPPWNVKQSPSSMGNSSPSIYPFKKYSHGSESTNQKGKHEKLEGLLPSPSFENKKLEEREKSGSESGIVTRHVFKKINNSTESVPTTSNTSASVDNKSLNNIGTQGAKHHNTNISIRTGLYDSSHSTQHDVKKSTLSPFCSRQSKAVNLHKANQHSENSNLLNKRIDYNSPNAIKMESLKLKSFKETNKEANDCTNDSKDVCKSKDESPATNALTSTNKDESLVNNVVSKETKELKLFDSSFDSLTPEKILHLINSKHNPLSKLLMGNMIGLTSEQTSISNTYDLSIVQADVESIKSDTEDKTLTLKNGTAKETKVTASYKFRRRRKLPRKITNKPEIRKSGKTHNVKLQKVAVQSSTILDKTASEKDSSKSKVDGQSNVERRKTNTLQEGRKNIKKNVKKKSEVITRLRTMRTMKSPMKKQMNKKPRREIANLLIDAKIGPKVRGPRNRRLRRINNIYAKQSYEPFSTAIRTLSKGQINSKISRQRAAFKAESKLPKINGYNCVTSKQTRNIKKSELNLKQNARHRSPNKDQVAGRTVNGSSFNDNADNNKKSKLDEKISVKSIKEKASGTLENRKRKLLQTASAGLKSSKIRKACKTETLKPCKTDAVTQCCLIKEPLLRNLKSNSRSEHYTFIKIEYGDVKDMKSEIYEVARSDDENRNHRTRRSNERQKSVEATCDTLGRNNSNEKEHSVSEERASAFVPVNTVDSDLKIARLRSLGFKPITSSNNDNDGINNCTNEKCSAVLSTKVLKQNVAEKFNKYTNEENDVVVYMDDELQYQDIEDEDKNPSSNGRRQSDTKGAASRSEHLNRMLEQDLESPWHGWKKVVTNKDTYWIGW